MRQFRQDGLDVGDDDGGGGGGDVGGGGGKEPQSRKSRARTRNPPLQKQKALFPRRASLEGADEKAVMTQRRRKKESFFPRRRFSNSAIEPIREILEEIEEEEKAAWEKVSRSTSVGNIRTQSTERVFRVLCQPLFASSLRNIRKTCSPNSVLAFA